MRFLGAIAFIILALLLFHQFAIAELDRDIENQFAWAQFTYNYSQHSWHVDAQDHKGQQFGADAYTLRETQLEVLRRAYESAPQK